MTEKYFIISTGRTGTRTLGNVLDTSWSVARHEPEPNMRTAFYSKLNNEITDDEALRKIKLNRALLPRNTKYIEANTFLAPFIPQLAEVFPNSKFIHLVRDGRDVARSGMSRKGHPNDRPEVWGNLYEFEVEYGWHNMTELQQKAWMWMRHDMEITKHLDKLDDDRYTTIYFENIFYSEERFYSDLVDYIGLPYNEIPDRLPIHNNTSNYAIPEWKDWNEEQTNQFNWIAEQWLRHHKYIE